MRIRLPQQLLVRSVWIVLSVVPLLVHGIYRRSSSSLTQCYKTRYRTASPIVGVGGAAVASRHDSLNLPTTETPSWGLPQSKVWKDIRGGSDEAIESDEDDEDETEAENNDSVNDTRASDISPSSPQSSTMVTAIGRTLGVWTLRYFRATGRAASAVFEPCPPEETTVPLRWIGTVQRMVRAFFGRSSATTTSETYGSGSPDATTDDTKVVTKETQNNTNYRSALARAYKIAPSSTTTPSDDDDDNNNNNSNNTPQHSPIHTGSLKAALANARDNARLMVILIPSKRTTTVDTAAVTSLLSDAVTKAAEAPSRRKESPDTGSFALYCVTADSLEARTIRKWSGVAVKSKHKPVLLVVYPRSAGTPPVVVANHHVNPPPSATSMAGWMRQLAKRHGKYYSSLLKRRQELVWHRERLDGYQGSVTLDAAVQRDRVQRASEEAAQIAVAEEARQAIRERRAALKEAMVEEPSRTVAADEVCVVALRFGNGSRGQRRFMQKALVQDVFDWIDAVFELDRETVELVTMNGSKRLVYEDVIVGGDEANTLGDSGFGRKVGLRVTLRKNEICEGNGGAKTDDSE